MSGLKPADLPLEVLPSNMVVHHLDRGAGAELPPPGPQLTFLIADEKGFTVVCPDSVPVASDRSSPGWRVLRVASDLDFAMVGVMAGLTGILAETGIPILAFSSYQTDYLLVRNESLNQAVQVLQSAGFDFVGTN